MSYLPLETVLGYKMVKFLRSIELVERYDNIRAGQGDRAKIRCTTEGVRKSECQVSNIVLLDDREERAYGF